MLVSVLVVPIRTVGNLARLFSLLGFIVVNLSVVRFRRRQPNLLRPFSVPYYPIPPILGIVFNILLGLFISPRTWTIAIGWLAVGAGVYVLLERRKERAGQSDAGGSSTVSSGADRTPHSQGPNRRVLTRRVPTHRATNRRAPIERRPTPGERAGRPTRAKGDYAWPWDLTHERDRHPPSSGRR